MHRVIASKRDQGAESVSARQSLRELLRLSFWSPRDAVSARVSPAVAMCSGGSFRVTVPSDSLDLRQLKANRGGRR